MINFLDRDELWFTGLGIMLLGLMLGYTLPEVLW